MADRNQVEMFRRLMPRQFTKTTKLCAKCGARVQWSDKDRALKCPRCKETF